MKNETNSNPYIPVVGMSKETFVQGYKAQSQMNVNKIISADISSKACLLIESLHERKGNHLLLKLDLQVWNLKPIALVFHYFTNKNLKIY